jgi:hypothetical protein
VYDIQQHDIGIALMPVKEGPELTGRNGLPGCLLRRCRTPESTDQQNQQGCHPDRGSFCHGTKPQWENGSHFMGPRAAQAAAEPCHNVVKIRIDSVFSMNREMRVTRA